MPSTPACSIQKKSVEVKTCTIANPGELRPAPPSSTSCGVPPVNGMPKIRFDCEARENSR
jgi:hypothetical protein